MNPKYTVVTNIVSPESDRWIGTCWEFFHEEAHAVQCYRRQVQVGNCPTMRPYYEKVDQRHLGAVHSMSKVND